MGHIKRSCVCRPSVCVRVCVGVCALHARRTHAEYIVNMSNIPNTQHQHVDVGWVDCAGCAQNFMTPLVCATHTDGAVRLLRKQHLYANYICSAGEIPLKFHLTICTISPRRVCALCVCWLMRTSLPPDGDDGAANIVACTRKAFVFTSDIYIAHPQTILIHVFRIVHQPV